LGSNSEDVVLDCYRLAKHYHLDPRIFLAMTISEIEQHMYRTGQIEQMRRAAEDD